ncbi:hypothetical protein WOLCODRAFT_147489 [Wolfiporia cocos MD-104 SS10]|uniref:Uncharacterized protein n=1 Tax=Wolfiporia cocos (strain MD-104) TaxID=742152 RepID=A0A2H3J6W3_WOLCO|nr:hypothetical protein WOLCODRAFT_147489 [Wolfiporia cocos MD-104 SS10]
MADAPEGDEFDNVPDLFDWAAIPDSLCLAADHADDSVPTSSSVAAEDEDLFEHFVDSLADVDWNTIPELAAIEASAVPSSLTRQTLAETARHPPSSPQPRHPVLPALNLSSSGVVGSLLLGEAVASVSASNAGSSHSYLHLVNSPANTAMDSQVAGAHEANALSHERATSAAPHSMDFSNLLGLHR